MKNVKSSRNHTNHQRRHRCIQVDKRGHSNITSNSTHRVVSPSYSAYQRILSSNIVAIQLLSQTCLQKMDRGEVEQILELLNSGSYESSETAQRYTSGQVMVTHSSQVSTRWFVLTFSMFWATASVYFRQPRGGLTLCSPTARQKQPLRVTDNIARPPCLTTDYRSVVAVAPTSGEDSN